MTVYSALDLCITLDWESKKSDIRTFFFREYIVYIVPILMLLFIGSLIVALICVKVRNCNFESLSLTGSRSTVPTTTTNSNGNLRVEMPRGTVYIFILGQLFTYSIPSCKGQLISE